MPKHNQKWLGIFPNNMTEVGNIERLCLFLGIALFPFYVFPSGGIQPAHASLALFAVIFILKHGIERNYVILQLLFLSAWVLAVETVYVLGGGGIRGLINVAFYSFNFLILATVYSYCLRCGYAVIRNGIVVSAIIGVISLIAAGVDLRIGGGRQTATFNNPNQLGYFSVCILSMSYILYRLRYFGLIAAVLIFGGMTFLSVASLSKAAMVATASVLFIALKPPMKNRLNFMIWSLSTLAGMMVLMVLVTAGYFDDYSFTRRMLGMFEEQDSSLEARGYFAFLQGNVFQILFGLGFVNTTDIVGHEVHSTFGSVFNNYGVVGLSFIIILFVVTAYRLSVKVGIIAMYCIMAPVVLYGITHNGMRFSLMWILMAMALAMVSGQKVGGRMRQRREQRIPHNAGRRRVATNDPY